MKEQYSDKRLYNQFLDRRDYLLRKMDQHRDSHEAYLEAEELLGKLKGAIEVIEYRLYGKLPVDGQHDGMIDHQPGS